MKRLVLRLIPLVLLYLKLSESATKLEPVIEIVRHNQCIKIASFLKNVFASNNVTRGGIVNVAIADYSLKMDTNCIIRELQDANERVLIRGITGRVYMFTGTPLIDYFIFIEEFSKTNSIKSRHPITSYFNPTPNFILITSFDDSNVYESLLSSDHFPQVVNFLNSLSYLNGIMIDIVDDSIRTYQIVKTFKIVALSHGLITPSSYLEEVYIFHYDTPPYSHRNRVGKIIGVEGNVIDEFCKRNNLSYRIINDNQQATINLGAFDISLFRRLGLNPTKKYNSIFLNDFGANQCFLVPKNIPVRYSELLDLNLSILFLLSVLIVAILWKLCQNIKKQRMTFFDLTVSMLKFIVGYSLSGRFNCRKWSLNERLLLIPFAFMCIILMEFFESFLTSLLIVDFPMRSVRSIEELNESGTMIFEFYDKINTFPSSKIKNVIPIVVSSALSKLPDHFDKNLVYGVRCKFAEEFVKSAGNYENRKPIFGMIEGFVSNNRYSSYLVNANFPFKSEFINMIASLQESGIMNYWTENTVRESFPKYIDHMTDDVITLSSLQFPLFMLTLGLVLCVVVFLIELVYHKYMEWKLRRVIDLREARQRREKWRRILTALRIKRSSKAEVYVLRRDRVEYEIDEM